jgi:hypothetical protein
MGPQLMANVPALISLVTGGMAWYGGTLLPEKHAMVKTFLYISGGLNAVSGITQLAIAPSIASALEQQQVTQGLAYAPFGPPA